MINNLVLSDFETKQANTASIETLILEKVIPKGSVFFFPRNPFEMFLATKFTDVGDGATTAFVMDDDLVDSPNLGDDKGAYNCLVDNVAAAAGTVNYATDTITFDAAPGNTLPIEIYHLFSEGNVLVRAANPSGTRFKNLYRTSLANLHQIDQHNIKSAPRFSNAVILPETFKLQVLLNSSVVVDFDSENLVSQICIDYEQKPLRAYPADIKQRVNASLI